MPTAFASTVEARFVELTPTAKRIANTLQTNLRRLGLENTGDHAGHSGMGGISVACEQLQTKPELGRCLGSRVPLARLNMVSIPAVVDPSRPTRNARAAHTQPLPHERKPCDRPIHRRARHIVS
jgi:hypothetical protein